MNAPYKAIDYIITNAPKYAKAKSERIYLEEFRKTKKALLMKVAMEAGYESAAAQEREAYAHPEYQELLRGLAVAIEQEETLKFMLTAAQMRSEVWRTESANERNGIKATE
jgi:biotin carboxylase